MIARNSKCTLCIGFDEMKLNDTVYIFKKEIRIDMLVIFW